MEPLKQVELTRYVKALKILSSGLEQLAKIEKDTETEKRLWEYYSKVFRAVKKDVDIKTPRLYFIQNVDENLKQVITEVDYLFYNDREEYKYFKHLRKFFIHLEESNIFFDNFVRTQHNSFVYLRSESLSRIDEFNSRTAEDIKRIIDKKIEEGDNKRGRWRDGIVYLLGNEQARILKIGRTIDLEQRLRHLQSNSAYTLEIIKTKEGCFDIEKAELLKAKNFRIQGEWFTWDDSIIENF